MTQKPFRKTLRLKSRQSIQSGGGKETAGYSHRVASAAVPVQA